MSIAETMIPPQAPPPSPPKPYTFSRFFGSVALGIWLALGVGIFLTVVNGWDPEKFSRYGPSFLSGLGVTLTLVISSILMGAVLSLPVALGRMSKTGSGAGSPMPMSISSAARRSSPSSSYYYGLGSFRPQLETVGLWWFFRDAWNCALFTFTLNTAAYQAEILRGAIESVPRGQREGAAALGLPERVAFIKVILPQAMIVALRPYGNEIILMIKGSAIVAIVTVFDLMGETRRAFSRTFDYQMYIWAAILYLLMVELLRNIWGWLEARLTRHLKR